MVNDDQLILGNHFIFSTSAPQNGELMDNGNDLLTYIPNPNFSGQDEFTYTVCSETCPDNCSEATVTVTVEGGENELMTIPSVITPNGDGLNDNFVVLGLEQYPGSTLAIYNRWGDEVYSSENYINDWEGTHLEEELPIGTYFYVLKVNDGQNTIMTGYVFLQRG